MTGHKSLNGSSAKEKLFASDTARPSNGEEMRGQCPHCSTHTHTHTLHIPVKGQAQSRLVQGCNQTHKRTGNRPTRELRKATIQNRERERKREGEFNIVEIVNRKAHANVRTIIE